MTKNRLSMLRLTLITTAMVFCLAPSKTIGQTPGCGTIITPEQQDYLDHTRDARQSFQLSDMAERSVLDIPVQIHIIRQSDGTGGLAASNIPTIMNELNGYFINANIQFYECASVNFIDSDTYYDFDSSEETALGNAHDVSNVINIYFPNTASSSGNSVCGYAWFPGGPERMFIAKGCATSGTVSHEMGHFFSLYHTHGKSNMGGTDELVNGSNCATAGDDVCDTPADPNLYGKVNYSTCAYTGSETDANGDPYVPNPHNVMSYAPGSCRNMMTAGQYNRVAYSALNDRTGYSCNSNPPPPPPPPTCNVTINSFPYAEGFETGLGDWTQGSGDDFDWSRQSGGTPSSGTGPSGANSGTYYVFTESSSPNNPSKTTYFVSPCFDISSMTDPEFKFYYHMTGTQMGTLSVQVSTDQGATWSGDIWSKTGDQGTAWQQAIVDLSAYNNGTVVIRLKGLTGAGFQSDMCVDDIEVAEGTVSPPPPPPPPTCQVTINNFPYSESFESGLGSWTQDSNDDIDWTQRSGSTPSSGTGPTGAQNGSLYFYTEASGNSNKKAYLISPCYDLTGVSSPELKFWYHMYGSSMGMLTISLSTDGGVTYSTSVWSRSGDQGNSWQEATINLSGYAGSQVRFRFEATTGGGYQSDISIDAINIAAGGAPPPPPPPPPPTCTTTINSFPYAEGFESGLGDWTQDSGDDTDWTRKSGSTGSGGTGPGSAQEGTYYLYIESSSPNYPSKTAILTSACYDITGLSNPELKFWYHMYGSTMGTLALEVSTDGGSTWAPNSLWSLTGDQGNLWQEVTIDLSAYSSVNTLKFRFKGTTGTSYRSDMSIDDIRVEGGSTPPPPPPPPVVTVSGNTTICAVEGSTTLTASGADTYTWAPATGLNTTTGAVVVASPTTSITYTVTGTNAGGNDTETISILVHPRPTIAVSPTNTTISSGATITLTASGGLTYSWHPPTGLSATTGTSVDASPTSTTVYTVTGTDVRGCTNSAISTVTVNTPPTSCPGAITAFPYGESFENGLNGWVQETNDDMNWTSRSTSTPSSSTGPSAAYNANNYLYTEASSSGSPSKTAILTSPCFDLSGLSNPSLSFWYHMYGADMGTMEVMVSSDGGTTWSGVVWSKSGSQGNAWLEATIDLSTYQSASVKVQIKGTTGASFRSDMAIDLIQISEDTGTPPPPPTCAGAISTFPYTESFESGFGVWDQSLSEDFDWTRRSGGTPSSSTGPSNAQDGSIYIYTEASSPNYPSKEAYLTSSCFDLTNESSANLSFWYHMYGSQMGTLAVQVSTDQGNSWLNTLWTSSGSQGNSWLEANVDLSAYVGGDIQLRLVGITGTGYRSDMAVDNLRIVTTGSDPTGIATVAVDENHLSVYPNPAHDLLNVLYQSSERKNVEMMITNALGKVIRSEQMNLQAGNNQTALDLNDYENGFYFLNFVDNNGKVETIRFVVIK